MTIHEPMTLATDYVLSLASLAFALLLWRRARRSWALAFAFTAAGSFLGGTFHGVGPEIGGIAAAALWKGTVISIGLASFFLLIAAVPHRLASLFGLLLFITYATWMIWHDEFLWVVIDYGISFIAVAVAHVTYWIRERLSASPWILSSFLLSVIAAVIQQSSVALGRMNHNDIYHVIQLVALALLFRGATLMIPATGRSTSRPT